MHSNPVRRDIPVVVVTAKDLTEEDRRVLSVRVEEIVQKGAWPRERVVALVQRLTSGHGGQASTG
jgi:CheY-like chemotaxis protein